MVVHFIVAYHVHSGAEVFDGLLGATKKKREHFTLWGRREVGDIKNVHLTCVSEYYYLVLYSKIGYILKYQN